jgi:predicted molibdopterin-dependent oxidoreductase YjgC
VQDNRIVKVTSPLDHDVGHGDLCVKGQFGFEFVQRRARESWDPARICPVTGEVSAGQR